VELVPLSLVPLSPLAEEPRSCYTQATMKNQLIAQIRNRFRREWLLIAVDRLDPRTQVPIRGRVLAHSPHRDEIYDRLAKTKGLTVVLYSEKTLPQGYAVAFRA